MDLFQKVERGTSFKIFSSIKRELVSDFVIEFRFQDTPWTCSFSDFDTTNCAAMSSSQILIKTRNFKTTVNIRDGHCNMTSGKMVIFVFGRPPPPLSCPTLLPIPPLLTMPHQMHEFRKIWTKGRNFLHTSSTTAFLTWLDPGPKSNVMFECGTCVVPGHYMFALLTSKNQPKKFL